MSLHFKRFFAIVSNSCYEFLYHKNPSLWWGNHDAKYRPTAFSIIAKSCSICWLSWDVLDFPAGDGRSTWRRSRVEIRAASVKVYRATAGERWRRHHKRELDEDERYMCRGLTRNALYSVILKPIRVGLTMNRPLHSLGYCLWPSSLLCL